MNAREILQNIIFLKQVDENVRMMPPSDSAALHELDRLLSDVVKIQEQEGMTSPNDYWLAMNDWFERAARAGYGEK